MKSARQRRPRAIEFFCGIGGFAHAAQDQFEIAAAFDINQSALEVYRANHQSPTHAVELESVSSSRIDSLKADLWWLSPPCQPFTKRGKMLGLADRRSRGLVSIIQMATQLLPACIALENVPGFQSSDARDWMMSQFMHNGYQTREWILCPSQYGVPNRRRRYYAVAVREPWAIQIGDPIPSCVKHQSLNSYVDPEVAQRDVVPERWLERYGQLMHGVYLEDPKALTTCFTSAYGRSPIRSGSYVVREGTWSFFSPSEVLRVLGFDREFVLAETISNESAWRLAGNSLSLHVVRKIIAMIVAPD